MMILDKTLVMARGQSATIKCEIFNEVDDVLVPYTMRLNLRNPHIRLQVRNSYMYEGNKGTIYNYYLPAERFILQTATKSPRFVSTLDQFESKNELVYMLDREGVRRYYCYNGLSVKEYKCHFKKTFLTFDTKRWREQDWSYSFSLVGGTLMIEYLQGIYDDLYKKKPDQFITTLYTNDAKKGYKSKRWLYDKICQVRPDFEGKVDWRDYFSSVYELDKLDGEHKLVIN